MPKAQPHIVKCKYCGKDFNRDIEPYYKVSNRYIHVDCYKKYNPNGTDELKDPTQIEYCKYCRKELRKDDTENVGVWQNREKSITRYYHKECKKLEDEREKTDREKLELYLQDKYDTDFLTPSVIRQINNYIDKIGYTAGGINGTLHYMYEVLKIKFDAKYGIGLVEHYYQKAKEYYTSISRAQNKNKNFNGKVNTKVEKVKIPSPKRNVQFKKLFSFLDEDEVNE